MDPLVAGSLYEITYILQSGNGQWYQWQMTAVFLWRKKDDFTDELHFSLRPKMGSTCIGSGHVHNVRLIKKDAGARSVQARQIQLPKRLKGAVPGPSDINRRQIVVKESW